MTGPFHLYSYRPSVRSVASAPHEKSRSDHEEQEQDWRLVVSVGPASQDRLSSKSFLSVAFILQLGSANERNTRRCCAMKRDKLSMKMTMQDENAVTFLVLIGNNNTHLDKQFPFAISSQTVAFASVSKRVPEQHTTPRVPKTLSGCLAVPV